MQAPDWVVDGHGYGEGGGYGNGYGEGIGGYGSPEE
jgi:hypothetical protein